jgi:hypothetical protein
MDKERRVNDFLKGGSDNDSKQSQNIFMQNKQKSILHVGGRRGRDRMIVLFTTTCTISAYHH